MKNVSFNVNQFYPPMIFLSASSPPLSVFLFLSSVLYHTLTFQSVHTFTNRSVATSSDKYIFGRILLHSFSLPSILLFSRQALFRSNECHNLEGEMISSRAFSCWTEHESLSLYIEHGVPFGTLLATRRALLKKSKLLD